MQGLERLNIITGKFSEMHASEVTCKNKSQSFLNIYTKAKGIDSLQFSYPLK